jgi:hypothetical protein
MGAVHEVAFFKTAIFAGHVDESPTKYLKLVPAQKSKYIFVNRHQNWPNLELCELLMAKIRIPKIQMLMGLEL